MVKHIEEVVRPRVQKFFNKPSKTRQEFKAECDLGLILKRFAKDPEGLRALLSVQESVPQRFEDVTAIPDYRTALDAVNSANAKFMALPAIVRRRFDNDAAQFLDFCQNPANLDELRKLGLAKPAQKDAVEASQKASE